MTDQLVTLGNGLQVALGNVGIGGGPTSYYGLGIVPTLTGTGDQRGISLGPVFDSTSTSGSGMLVSANTTSQPFTLATGNGIRVANFTKGGGSSITTVNGILIDQLTAGTNNYAIQAAHPGASGYAIYITGASVNPVMRIDDTTITTVGATGGAAAPPANPAEYLLINVNGNNRKIALYNP